MSDTLIALVRALDPFERHHVNSIWIKTSHRGYKVSFDLRLYRPDDPHWTHDETSGPVARLTGVDCTSVVKAPDIVGYATWTIPIWSQIEELVRDPEMSLAANLGIMIATEESTISAGIVADNESQQYWRISTHGLPRSPERASWMRDTDHNA